MKRTLFLILIFVSTALQATHGSTITSPKAVYQKASLSVVKVVATVNNGTLQGSGVVIANGGKAGDATKPTKNIMVTNSIIATNAHVVSGAVSVIVVYKGKSHKAEIDFLDGKSDIAILHVQGFVVPKSQISTETVSIGDKVYAIGSPLGLDNSISEGIVSGMREADGVRYIQTTAPISPGNSGGGLFNEHGDLVGITSFRMKNGENINFALGAEALMKEWDGYSVTIVLSADLKTSRTGGFPVGIPPDITALLADVAGRGKLTRFFALTTDNGKSWFDTFIESTRDVMRTNNATYGTNWMNHMAQKYNEFAASEQEPAKNPATAPAAHRVKLNCNLYNSITARVEGTNMDMLVRIDFDKSTVNGYHADINEDYIRWNVHVPGGANSTAEINRTSGTIRVTYDPDPKLGYLPPSSGTCVVATGRQF